MFMKNTFRATLGALAFVALSSVSTSAAIVVTDVAATNTDLVALAAAGPTTLPAGAIGNPLTSTSGSVGGDRRSPFDNLGTGNFEGISYFTVASPSLPTSGSPVELMFSGLQTSFKMLWGSVDRYNTLNFFKGDVLVGSATGGVNVNPATGRDASIVTVTGIQFDKVEFVSTQAALEFSNIQTTAIPLPAGGLLLLSGLAGIAALRRRKTA